MSGPTQRALQLLSLLQTHRYWAGSELAERLGVSLRTLRRDVDRLRELGYPIEATRGVDGGYRLEAGSHIPPLLVDDDEAVAIAVGLRAAAYQPVEGIEETSVRALAKLDQVLPSRLRRRVSAVFDTVSTARWHPERDPSIDPEVLASLSRACRDHEQARFHYRRRDGEQSMRSTEPHHIVALDGRWYLVAWDQRRDDWRTFRIDRLTGLRLQGARFHPRRLPADTPAEFVTQSVRRTPRRHETVVIVEGPPERLKRFLGWVDARVEAVDETRSRVTIRDDYGWWIANVVAMLGLYGDVQIERADPPEITDLLGTLAGRIQAMTE